MYRLALVVTLLAACGPKPAPSPTPTPEPEPASQEPAPEPISEEPPARDTGCYEECMAYADNGDECAFECGMDSTDANDCFDMCMEDLDDEDTCSASCY